jgi:hypothetical protein
MRSKITDHGAVGNGVTLNTKAIQKAIDAAHAAGGGTVRVPAGDFLTGTIELKSRVTLHLGQGARLLGSPDLADYPARTWGHHDDRLPYHLIYASEAEHVAIRGDGVIDGNGQHFIEPGRTHEWAFHKEIPMRPSPMVEISRCRNVRVEGIRLTRPGGWTLHLHDCDRAFIRGITIDNSMFWPNSDGIDLTGCHDTMVSDCFIRTGDDAIALKTTDDSRSCEHIVVTNCVLETSCAAIRLGFESDRDFRNCVFSNITVKNCSRVIDLLTFAGGSIENCSFTNIVGRCMSGWPFDRVIEVYASIDEEPYKVRIREHPNFGKKYTGVKPGRIRGITITNLDIETCGRALLGGSPKAEVGDISLDHIRLRYPMIEDPGIIGRKAAGKGFFGDLPDVCAARAALVAQNIDDLRVRDFRVEWPTYPVDPDRVELLRSENRKGNPYFADFDAVVSGESAPPFSAAWLDNVTGSIETGGLTGTTIHAAAIHIGGGDVRMLA